VTCTTGALHFRRLDGGAQEEAAAETTVEPRPNGPLFVHGRLKIVGAGGHVIREDTRFALCRCGASQNKPFCDGSHRRVGFTHRARGRRGHRRGGRPTVAAGHRDGRNA
jgi:CDGSH-type Zn-finger protein